MKLKIIVALFILVFGASVLFENAFSNTETKLVASDAAESDLFGRSVSISGDTVIVGAQLDDDAGTSSGSAYIYKFDGTNWIETKLVASDAAGRDQFGFSVSISGDTAIVGSNLDDDGGTSSGSAYIYKFDGANWIETKLVASDAAESDLFGQSVSVSDDTAIVGSYLDDDGGTDSGSAYIYKFDGTNWIETKLVASDAASNNLFGRSVSVSGDTAIVGSSGDDSSSGSAYIYKFDGANWNETKLVASDAAGNDQFGFSVSISGDTAIVGSFLDDDAGTDSGSAYIYKFDGTNWNETKLVASDAAGSDQFGRSVSISDDTTIVGSQLDDDAGTDSGSAYVFSLNPGIEVGPLEEALTIVQTMSFSVLQPIVPNPFEQTVSIEQNFSTDVFQPLDPSPFNQLVSIVQDFSTDVFQPLDPSPFNQLVSIVQNFSTDVFQPLSPPVFSESISINQNFGFVVISDEANIEQLIEDIQNSELDEGIKKALIATLKNIESELASLEFSATSLVTSSSNSSTDETNSKKQSNEVCGKLGAFINKVNALTGKKINPEDAASFIATAEGIKENFGC